MIIVIRHAQSEGNQNRAIHQTVPDHRVKLTPHGWTQAEEAGQRLRSLLRPDDTLQFYTSPYRRTRETTEGILRSLTSDVTSPSPFPRHTVKVWEEPRLREQDFGNFQPSSAAMERMWQERADYGHFFYRIPNGESAADAYDRVSGFNESLWRSFAEQDFPSVCVLVTHGLMTRVFLMKWYHWSVEYFEDLRNVDHCEFVVMRRASETDKFVLQNELRTWSELKRQRADDAERAATQQPPPRKIWGGCAEGCTHDHVHLPRQQVEDPEEQPLPNGEREDAVQIVGLVLNEEESEAFPRPADMSPSIGTPAHTPGTKRSDKPLPMRPSPHRPLWLDAGRDFGGSQSGAATPAGGLPDTSDYGFPQMEAKQTGQHHEWVEQAGMRTFARADALGDHTPDDDSALEAQEATDKSLRGSVY